MLATPQPASKMTGGPGNVPTDLSKTAHGPFRTPKSSPRRLPGASLSTLRAALGPPRSRQARNMQTAAEGAPTPAAQREHLGPLVTPSPPRYIDYVLTLPHSSSRLSVLSSLPSRRTQGVGGLTGLRPLPPTPKEDLAVSNMRMARSDFSYEYLDEEFNPRRMMLNQDESCSRHLNQLPR